MTTVLQWATHYTCRKVRRVATAGAACGVVCGCLMGMSVLLTLDTTAKEREKKQREMAS